MISSFKSSVRKWVVPSSSGQHWDAVDGLRGIAILMVVFCHGFYANPHGPEWTQWLGAFIGAGAYGVHVFFVISGFLIAQPFLSAKMKGGGLWYPQGYATRRVLKIFPPFYLAIVLLGSWYFYQHRDLSYIITGLQWAVGIPHVIYVAQPFNGSFWSLWVELGFYLVLPILFWLLRARPVGTTVIWIAGLLLVVPLLTRSLDWPASRQGGLYMLYISGRFPNALTNFAWGVLFAGLFAMSRKNPGLVKHWSAVGYAGVVLLTAVMALRAWTTMQHDYFRWIDELGLHLCGLATFLMLFFVFNPATPGARLLSRPGLRYLGLVSYEWFLLHQPMIMESIRFWGSARGSFGRYLLIVGVPMILSLAIAMFIYHFFSMPIIQWGRKKIKPSQNSNLAPGAKPGTAATP
ncbi:MAG: acyltransferase [Verrucomicrobia bacterium]|nr:acyltransferase [Verrucomicrobiota bacterium]